MRPESGRGRYARSGSSGLKVRLSPRSSNSRERTGAREPGLVSPTATLTTRCPSSLRASTASFLGTQIGSRKGVFTRNSPSFASDPTDEQPARRTSTTARVTSVKIWRSKLVMPAPLLGGGDGEAGIHGKHPAGKGASGDLAEEAAWPFHP